MISLTAIGTILSAVLLISWLWTRVLTRQVKELGSRVYSCPHVGPDDFSGGYRDNAREGVKCTYKVRCFSQMSRSAGTWTARCPVHHCDLVGE